MRRALAILLLVPAVAGCFYRRTVFTPLPQVEEAEPQHQFTVVRSVVYFPMVGHEWDLNLTIPSSRVREGEVVEFPGPGVRASYFEAYEPGRTTATPTGRIRFLRVRSDAVQAEVDMRARARSDWSLRRTLWFRYAPHVPGQRTAMVSRVNG